MSEEKDRQVFDVRQSFDTARIPFGPVMNARVDVGDHEAIQAIAANITESDIAPEDEAWSFSAQDGDAIIEKLGWAGFAKAHAVVDLDFPTDDHEGHFPKVKAAYRLPFQKLHDGTLKAFWEGARTAMGVLCGLQGETGLSLDVKKKAFMTLSAFFCAFNKGVPIPPWQKPSSSKGALFRLAETGELPSRITLVSAVSAKLPRTIWVRDIYDAQGFTEEFYNLLAKDSKTDILIAINSPGGFIYELNHILNIIKTSPVDVRTCIFGIAMSAAFVLTSAGTKGKRFAFPYATGMVHEVSGWAGGSVGDLASDTDEAKRLNSLIFDILAKNTGHASGEEIIQAIRKNPEGKRNQFLDAEGMKTFGLVDKIVSDLREILPEKDTPEEGRAEPKEVEPGGGPYAD